MPLPHAPDPADPNPSAVYTALWLGALLAATGALADPLPAELDELAARYFALFPPAVKACQRHRR